jgi:pseudaminic acid synthase
MGLEDSQVYIIAELSANHRQKMAVALDSIRVAASCGVDAVKIQTYTPDTLTIDCENEYFKIGQGTPWDGRTLHELYREAFTPWEWHPELKRCADEHGIDFLSSPFDRTAVDLLASLRVTAFKIASFEINDLELVDYACSKERPVLLSTGVATLAEIEAAVGACRARGIEPVLLHCVSSYPALPSEMNLAMIMNMKATFGVRVGLSDHTNGTAVAVAAVALGATVIEKHFILDKSLGGPDAQFSMEPEEFSRMVEDVRAAAQAVGRIDYSLSEAKRGSRKFMRSLFVVEDIAEGQTFSRRNVRCIRPGDGLSPSTMGEILGRKAKTDIARGTPLSWKLIQ